MQVYGNPDIDLKNEERADLMRLMVTEYINEANLKKMTSLHAACLSGNVHIVKLLLDNGGDLHSWDQVSRTISQNNN